MKSILRSYILLLLTILGLTSFIPKPKTEIREDFKKFYAKYKVEGSFVLYDQNKDKYIIYNRDQTSMPFTPASTFKICNSLIGLETGVIKDENASLKWDKTVYLQILYSQIIFNSPVSQNVILH